MVYAYFTLWFDYYVEKKFAFFFFCITQKKEFWWIIESNDIGNLHSIDTETFHKIL